MQKLRPFKILLHCKMALYRPLREHFFLKDYPNTQKFGPNWKLHSVKSRAVDRATIQFGPFCPKVTVHKHKISPSWTSLGVLLINRKFKVLKSIHFWNSVFSLYENKVLQLMPAGASLERFGEKDLVFIKWRVRRHCFKNKWTLVSTNDNKKKQIQRATSYLRQGNWHFRPLGHSGVGMYEK